MTDRMDSEPQVHHHECAGADGEHACGGRGSPDGVCRHEDGASHPCCRTGEAELILDLEPARR